jgi:uncharacterized membrane protein YhaH (DUF805 family)
MSMSRLLFSFRGRLNRQPYWLASIVIIVLMLLLVVLEFGWIALAMVREHEFWASDATLTVIVILYLPLLFVALALAAKRLHDRDKSAWWLLLFYLAPSVLSGAANHAGDVGFSILYLASFAITVWAFVELGCLRGTVGPNRFGPDPLAPAALAAA